MKIHENARTSRVVQVLIFVLIAWLGIEFLSMSVIHFILSFEVGDYARHYRNDPKLNLLTWTEGYTPHPYFGYESASFRASEAVLSELGEDEFVIGILGGSVAGGFAEYAIKTPVHFDSLREVFPTFGKKTLRIVNLANGGYKQPQQFFVSAYFMDKLDLIINIDGFNDAMSSHLLPIYPLEFPNLSAQFYGRASQGGLYATLGRSVRWIYKTITRVPLAIPGLSRSNSYFLCWYALHEFLYRAVKASESMYYAAEFGAYQSESLRKASPKDFIRKRLAIWKKYTILEDDLVRKRTGKLVYFFLQPNQYLKDSKPFSEQERRVAFNPSHVDNYHEMMILLRAAAQDLRRSGVPMVDLTATFSRTDDTVYKDDCCHVNELGNQIMADAIVSNIIAYQRSEFR
jgi:hypothetical protein